MKRYNVTTINPRTGRPCTFMSIPENQLQTPSGEQVLEYNHCKIISIEQVPQAYLDAQLAYFDKFGTAAE